MCVTSATITGVTHGSTVDADTVITCAADDNAYPSASFRWTNEVDGSQSTGSHYLLQHGTQYKLTCTASNKFGRCNATPMQNFIKIRLPPFAPQIRENSRRVTRLVFFLFFLQPTAKTPAPIFTINTSNDVASRKDVPFGGPENKILHFDPIFPKKRKFLANFRWDLENFASKRP